MQHLLYLLAPPLDWFLQPQRFQNPETIVVFFCILPKEFHLVHTFNDNASIILSSDTLPIIKNWSWSIFVANKSNIILVKLWDQFNIVKFVKVFSYKMLDTLIAFFYNGLSFIM